MNFAISGVVMCTSYMYVCMFVGSCLATKVFICQLPATGEGWDRLMMKGDHGPTK